MIEIYKDPIHWRRRTKIVLYMVFMPVLIITSVIKAGWEECFPHGLWEQMGVCWTQSKKYWKDIDECYKKRTV